MAEIHRHGDLVSLRLAGLSRDGPPRSIPRDLWHQPGPQPPDRTSSHRELAAPGPDPGPLTSFPGAGSLPCLARVLRLTIAIRSGKAAKVVPKPARRPETSDRWKPGTSGLCTSSAG